MNPAAVKTVATEATISPKGVGSPIAIVQTVAVILRHHSPIFPQSSGPLVLTFDNFILLYGVLNIKPWCSR